MISVPKAVAMSFRGFETLEGITSCTGTRSAAPKSE